MVVSILNSWEWELHAAAHQIPNDRRRPCTQMQKPKSTFIQFQKRGALALAAAKYILAWDTTAFICCISNDKKGNRKKTLERRKMRSARAAVGRVSVSRLSSTFVVTIIWSFEPFLPEFWVRFIQTIREGFQKKSCTIKSGLLPTHEHAHTTSTTSLAKDQTFYGFF